MFELINANDEVNPFALAVGELLDVPGRDRPGASVWIAPNSGTMRDEVTLKARNLRPGDWVTVGVGPRSSEWRRIDEVQVNADGTLTASVEVPDWADPGDDLIFVVDTDRGMTFKSGVFDVIARDGDDGRTGDGGQDRERMALQGRVRQGAECTILRTPDGNTWSMVSDDVESTVGEYVEVRGTRAEASFCMQGIGTIDVSSIEEVAPPQDSGDGDQAGMTLEGRVARGAECYRLKTPDGDTWSLTSSNADFTEGEYLEVSGRKADMSVCIQGIGTLQVSSIDEVQPPR